MVAILSSIISAAAALIVCLINNHYQRKRDKSTLAQEKEKEKEGITAHLEEIKDAQNDFKNQIHNEIEMVKYQLSELKKDVEKHNSVIERTYELEKRTDIQEEKIQVANHRIKNLETDLRKAVGQ